MSDEKPKRPSSDKLTHAVIVLDALDRIEAEAPAVLKMLTGMERSKLFGVYLTEEQWEALAKGFSRIASKHIAKAVDDAISIMVPRKVQTE